MPSWGEVMVTGNEMDGICTKTEKKEIKAKDAL